MNKLLSPLFGENREISSPTSKADCLSEGEFPGGWGGSGVHFRQGNGVCKGQKTG